MFKKLIVAAAFSLLTTSAFAVCADLPLPIKDANGSTVNMSTKTASDGSCSYYIDTDAGSTLLAAIKAALPLQAQNAEQAAGSNGTPIAAVSDLTGKQIVLPYANPENFLDGTITTAMTGTTDTVLTGMDLQGSGVRVYVTGCTVSNSHATQGTDVVLKNGSAGTVLWTFPAAPAFGGATMTFPTPLKTSANTGLYAANITTGSNTKISCTGYKGV